MSGSLAAVREVWAQRDRARTRGDVLYLLYVVVLGAGVIAVPALRLAGSALTRPDVLPVLLADGARPASAALAFGIGAGLVLLGGVRGPALLSPFFTATLAASGIRRRSVLWRPFARALLLPVTGTTTLAVLLGAVLVSAGHATGAGAAWGALAAAGTGLLLAAGWLAGQLLEHRGRRLLALALAAGAVLCLLLPAAAGPGGAHPVGAVRGGVWASGLLIAGVLATGAGVALLDRLRGQVLREQSARWESAATIATTGDLAGAAGAFRAAPTTGRRWRAIGSGPLIVLYARRDAVAWLRSPDRLVSGLLGATSAAAALAGSTLLTGPLAWAAVLLGAAGLWAASGALVDGIRHAVHTLGAPDLLGQSAGVQAWLHTPAPTLLLVALGALGALGGGGLGAFLAGGAGLTPDAVLLPVALMPVLIAGRVRDAAKGPLPLSLMTPMPTAQGDLAVIPLLLWQGDAVLLAMLAGVALAALGPLGPGWLLGAAALLTTATALLARGRLRALRG
ncbi:hypothetical protein [Brachybacterium sp. UNK5269]|uniref:hypothetical protein n=1 Tax=Brachybacterium sp. UNK5269 TaxID=3408576 RepID=UPI003BB1F1A3